MGKGVAVDPLNAVYTLDTNVIIYYTKGEQNVVSFVEDLYEKNALIYISTATETELFAYPDLRGEERERIENFLRTVAIISVDSRIARSAGELKSVFGLQLGDAMIAATALFTGTTLLTRNTRDFKKVLGLRTEQV